MAFVPDCSVTMTWIFPDEATAASRTALTCWESTDRRRALRTMDTAGAYDRQCAWRHTSQRSRASTATISSRPIHIVAVSSSLLAGCRSP